MKIQDVQKILEEFWQTSPLNTVRELDNLVIFDRPLIGVAAVDDPIFEMLKQENVVASHHASPREWLEEASSVISYFLPYSEMVRKANRIQGVAAKEWLYGRIEGEQFNSALREHLAVKLREGGCQAVNPGRDQRFKVIDRRSNWSERHVAYIAGLGTFSLSRSLITAKGAAGRLGSVITNLELEPVKRAYSDPEEYCIQCGACILRCPPLAIDEKGKDNAVCSAYLDRVLRRYQPRYGCGKCQTAVPCEHSIPRRRSGN